MASDDTYEIYRGACICGKGHCVVVESEPDHPWARASQRQWRTLLECPECAAKYAIEHRGRDFVVVRKEDVQTANAALNAVAQARADFVQRADVQVVKRALTSHLQSIKAKAEAFRQIRDAGYYVETPGTFSRNYPGAEKWVERNFTSPNDVVCAMKLLGRHRDPLTVEATTIANAPTPAEARYEPVLSLPVHAGH